VPCGDAQALAAGIGSFFASSSQTFAFLAEKKLVIAGQEDLAMVIGI